MRVMEEEPSFHATPQPRRSGLAIASWMLVVIGLASSLLLLIFLPACSDRGPSEGVWILRNGRSICNAVLGDETSAVATNDHGVRWPKSGEFSTSTAYFTNLVGRGVLNVPYSFFAAPGFKPCKGTNPAQFKAENNAWCVVADLKDTDPDNTPFLFTRNLRIASLAEFRGSDQVDDVPPFGRKGVAVIFKGGSAIVLRPEALASNFPAMGTATNRVLRP